MRFETKLTNYLHSRGYPCPAPLRRKPGGFVGTYRYKPYALFTLLEGRIVRRPNAIQRAQLIGKVAELQIRTRAYRPSGREARWNYSVAFCRERAKLLAATAGTAAAAAKRRWMEQELNKLVLPQSLPMGVCHCDFHFSNSLFKGNELVGILDFDDANFTYLSFDLVNLMGWFARPDDLDLDFSEARRVLREYETYRPLGASERRHLYDVHKLSILIDGLWFFDRGDPSDFKEKRKMERMNALGSDGYYAAMFW